MRLRTHALPAFALATWLGACDCGGLALRGINPDVQIKPSTVDFGEVYLHAAPRRALTLVNRTGAAETVSLQFLGEPRPFSLASATVPLGPGVSRDVEVTFSPVVAGAAQAVVQLQWSGGTNAVALLGRGVEWPPCDAASPCEEAVFDPDAGVCNHSAKAEGMPCPSPSTCIENARCQAGACVGTPRSCDDGSVCTTDFCVEGQGCQHQDHSAACQGSDPCQAYRCDPSRGCTANPVPDGTPCSLHQSCQRAEICLRGACTGVPVPDGTPCKLWWAPCASDASCQAGDCHSPTADLEKPGGVRWIVPSQYAASGGGFNGPAALDASGTAYLDDRSGTGGGDLVALGLCGQTRWRLPQSSSQFWTNGRHLIDRDQLISVKADETIETRLMADGSVLWQTDLRPSLGIKLCQSLPAPTGCASVTSFRIQDVALSNGGRLFAAGDFKVDGIWQANQLVPLSPPQYHRFLGAVLTNGTIIWAQELPAGSGDSNSPRFGYPLVVDDVGNLYVAYHAPMPRGAQVVSRSNVESYDPSGAFRWSLTLPTSYQRHYAFSPGYLLEPATLASFTVGGALRYPIAPDTGETYASGHSPVIDAGGTAVVLRTRTAENGQALPRARGELVAIGPGGALLWTAPFPSSVRPASSVVLGDLGQVFVATTADPASPVPYPGDLRCFDIQTGQQLWTVRLPGDGHAYEGVLALADQATLLVSTGNAVIALFAGKTHMPRNAPWPRFRGDNTNRASPALPAFP